MMAGTSSRTRSGPQFIERAKKQRLNNKMSAKSDGGTSPVSVLSGSRFVEFESRASTPAAAGTPIFEYGDPEPDRNYRKACEAPDSFKEQIQIQLEEKIYHTAIQRLQQNLSMGTFQYDAPVWVAPPAHTAFLGTLVVHPKFTAHPETDNDRMLPARAHQYLVDVLQLVGPINGNFKSAFVFRDTRDARTNRRRRGVSEESQDVGSDADDLKTPLANADSLWSRVPDFWSMLVWAFNCAVLYPDRWTHWKLWLEFMIDVLEKDVRERKRLDEELHVTSGASGEVKYRKLSEAMIVSYIGNFAVGQIMRVLFSFLDGESHPAKEVWAREIQSRVESKTLRLGKKLDLDNNQFGDYLDEEEEESEDEAADNAASRGIGLSDAPKRRQGRPKKIRMLPLEAHPLLEQTITIRRRIFELLSFICHYLEDDAPFDLSDLYDKYAANVRDLSLDVYPHFVAYDPQLNQNVYITFVRYLAARLLPPEAVPPGDVDPDTDGQGSLSALIMEKCFLPYASNRVMADNAKLAVLLWDIFGFLFKRGVGPTLSPGMRDAIEEGILQREQKAKLKPMTGPSDVIDEAALASTMGVIANSEKNEKTAKSVKNKKKEKVNESRKSEYSADNVLRYTHLQFRFMLQKEQEARRRQENALGSEFLGWL